MTSLEDIMSKALIIAVLLTCSCGVFTFADQASTNAVVQGNQGYIYGTPPKPDATPATSQETTSADFHPIGSIFKAINKADDWIQRNLW